MLLGLTKNDGGGDSSGHVRIYQYSGSSWVQLGDDIDGESPYDYSGHSVSLSSDGMVVAIGAYGNNGGNFTGHVRVYSYYNDQWNQRGADLDGEAAVDQSGYSVSLSSDGTKVAIGAPFNDANGSSSGHVRVYQV